MKKLFLIFSKAQVSALIGGLCDYALMIFLTEMVSVHYSYSILISGIVGAAINFSINKLWAFRFDGSLDTALKQQLIKFLTLVFSSIALKGGGTFLVSTMFNMNYKISRLFVELGVSCLFNFPLMRLWVFKKKFDIERGNESILFI